MARFPPPVTMITCSRPEAMASSTPYWMVGLSTSGSISFGCTLVTGRNRVPSPAAGKTARRTVRIVIQHNVRGGLQPIPPARRGRPSRAGRRRRPAHPPRGWGRPLRHTLDDPAHGADRPPLGDPLPGAGADHGRL